METNTQTFFREYIAEQMTKEELVDRVVEYKCINDELKKELEKYTEIVIEPARLISRHRLLYIFLEDLREYMRESNNNIGYDERDTEEFIEIFKNNHPHLIIENDVDWDLLINGLSERLETEHNKPKDDFFNSIISYIEEKYPNLIGN